MRSDFIQMKDYTTLVMTEGKWIEDNFGDDEKEVFILIPGNPGFADFYTTFIKHLHEATNIPVWTFSKIFFTFFFVTFTIHLLQNTYIPT